MAREDGRTPLRLPAELVRTPGALPDSCAQHGRPAVRRVDLVVQSDVRLESRRTSNVAGMVARFAEYGRTVRVADVQAWPLCRRCSWTRTVWFGLALALFWGGAAAFAGVMLLGLVVPGAGRGLAAVACGGLLGMLAAVLPFRRGSLPRVIGIGLAADGGEVIVKRPHPAFTAALRGSALRPVEPPSGPSSRSS